MIDKLDVLDTRLFLWLNSHHSPFWDQFMYFVSGKAEWIPLYLILAAYIIYRYKFQSILILIGAIIAVSAADQLAVHAFKNVFERLRPSQDPEIASLVHIVNNYRGGLYGFVSNHAANTFALATFLILLIKNKWFRLFILCWALLVSYSRIYLGVHYPADILGGALLGMLIAWMVWIGLELKTQV